MDSGGQAAAMVVIERHAGRVACLSRAGWTAGYLYAFDSTRPASPARWWRRGLPEEVALGWLIEWTDPARAQNGYTDEASDACGVEDVLAVSQEWDSGRHQHGDEWFDVQWLSAQAATDLAARFGWPLAAS